MKINYKLIEKIYSQLSIIKIFNNYSNNYYIFFYTVNNNSTDLFKVKQLFKSVNVKLKYFNPKIIQLLIKYNLFNNFKHINSLFIVNKGIYVIKVTNFEEFRYILKNLYLNDNILIFGSLIKSVYWSNIKLKDYLLKYDFKTFKELSFNGLISSYIKPIINLPLLLNKIYQVKFNK